MAKSDYDVLKIADKVGLTASDIKAIQKSKKRKKLSFSIVLVFETIIGVLSYFIGYAVAPFTDMDVIVPYPFGPTILFGNVSLFSAFANKKSLIGLIAVTFFVFIVGFLSGNAAGESVNYTYVPLITNTSVRYGVYSNKEYR